MQAPALLQHLLDSRFELAFIERLGQEAIGTQRKGAQSCFMILSCGQKQDRDVRCGDVFAQSLQHLETIDIGHHQVADDQVGQPPRRIAVALFAVIGSRDAPALAE